MKYKLDKGAHSVYSLQFEDYNFKIKRNYSEIREKLWKETFWSPSYFLATTGQVTLSQLKAYVEGQRKKCD